MLRKTLSLFVLVALCLSPARATIIVHDPGKALQDAGNEIVNLAKWSASEAHEAKIQIDSALTQLNTLRTYEQTVLEVVRLGNPAALMAIPGVRDVAELVSTGQQIYGEYQQLQAYFNPQNYQGDITSVLSAFQQPNWQGFTTMSGYSVPPAQSLYQFDTARWNTTNQSQILLSQIQQQRQTLQQQRDVVSSQLESATTVSDVQKYSAQLANLNAAIAELDQRSQQVIQQDQLQHQKIYAGQQISQAAAAERQGGQQYQAIDLDLQQLPANDFHQAKNW
jgi:hypothetical protein